MTPTIVTIRPGVQFTPDAAASFRRTEHQLGRRVDVNSTYRDWDKQMGMYLAWEAYVNGTGPKPPHSRAIHPKYSIHCQGKALDSDDWRDPEALRILTENGWIRTAASDPTERHHFEYQSWRDKHLHDPIPKPKPTAKPKPTPTPAEPEEDEDDMYKPTVHARVEGGKQTEWTLGHPEFGADLPQFTGTATDQNSRYDATKTVKTFRGFMVTTDRDVFTAWARTYAKGTSDITSSTDREGYVAIQRELSRIATEAAKGEAR